MKPGRKPTRAERRVLHTVYLPASLAARVDAVAKSRGLSRTAFLEGAVAWWLNKYELPVSKADQAIVDGSACSTQNQGVEP